MKISAGLRHIIVVIGGTGVIGSAFAAAAGKRGFEVVSLSLDRTTQSASFSNIQIDLNHASKQAFADMLQDATRGRKVALVLDVFGLGAAKATVLAEFAALHHAAVAVISSCLLYDHDGSGPVDEDCPLVDAGPGCHPYLRDKLAVDAFWLGQSGVDWRIFRCHHILGAGSVLGCVPNHNRDQSLRRHLRDGGRLDLARGGEILLSWIHPTDLANGVLTICADPESIGRAINMAAPQPVLARDYYKAVARLLGLPVPVIRSVVPDPTDFWTLTARDNIFISKHKFYNMLNFRYDIVSAIKDAMTIPEADLAQRSRFMMARISGSEAR